MKFVLDTLGADLGAGEVVKGIIQASKERSDLEFVLFGNKEEIDSLITSSKVDKSRFEVIDARKIIHNEG